MNLERLKKLNVRIEFKKEKEIKQLLSFLLIMVVLKFVLYEGRDYIWNIPLYKLTGKIFPFIGAIPAVVFFKLRKRKFKDLFEENILKQILIGVLIGIVCSSIVLYVLIVVRHDHVAAYAINGVWPWIRTFLNYLLIVALVEEFAYRVEVQERVENICGRAGFIAPLISAIIFGLMHFVTGTFRQVVLSFFFGCVLGYAKKYIKKCTFVSVLFAHAVYDMIIVAVPTINYYIKLKAAMG